MPTVNVLNIKGETVGTIDLSEAVFGVEPNVPAMHAVVVNHLANARQGTQSTKTRTEVSGGGRKPYRQKGTGRARQGSTRSPQFRHGGIVFGPKPRSFRYTLNKKLRQLALRSALSSKVAGGRLIVLDQLQLDEIRTKTMVGILKAVGFEKKALVVTQDPDPNVVKSARNIPGVCPCYAGSLNVYDIIRSDQLIITRDAVARIEEAYAK